MDANIIRLPIWNLGRTTRSKLEYKAAHGKGDYFRWVVSRRDPSIKWPGWMGRRLHLALVTLSVNGVVHLDWSEIFRTMGVVYNGKARGQYAKALAQNANLVCTSTKAILGPLGPTDYNGPCLIQPVDTQETDHVRLASLWLGMGQQVQIDQAAWHKLKPVAARVYERCRHKMWSSNTWSVGYRSLCESLPIQPHRTGLQDDAVLKAAFGQLQQAGLIGEVSSSPDERQINMLVLTTDKPGKRSTQSKPKTHTLQRPTTQKTYLPTLLPSGKIEWPTALPFEVSPDAKIESESGQELRGIQPSWTMEYRDPISREYYAQKDCPGGCGKKYLECTCPLSRYDLCEDCGQLIEQCTCPPEACRMCGHEIEQCECPPGICTDCGQPHEGCTCRIDTQCD